MSDIEQLTRLFLRFVGVQAPSGFEEPMMKALQSELIPYVDEVKITTRGNVIAVQKGPEGSPKIALAAHMDQIGFIVFNIDQAGWVRFRKIGGSVNRCIQGQQVTLHTSKWPVSGVVGVKPGHVTPPSEANTVPAIEEMYIDIGARSREEVASMGVKPGVPVTFAVAPVQLANGLISTPSVDDRAGVAALVWVARSLWKEDVNATIYYIGTVEEEIGLRGSEVALSGLDVDVAIAVDTFPAGLQPDINMRDILYEVGKGPAIHIGEIGTGVKIASAQPHRWLVGVAERHGIPHQVGLMHGGTDAMSMMQTGSGIPSCTIGIPRRYSHSPIEVFDPKDLHNLTKILTGAIKEIDQYNPNRI